VKNKGNFRVAPEGAEFWANSGSRPEDGGESGPALVREDALPRGIRFTFDEPGAGADEPGNDTVLPSEDVAPDMWTGVVTFLPDGTASTPNGTDVSEIKIVFQARNAVPLLLKLRTLTGTVTVHRLTDEGGRP
jgi:hypothetical protein